MGDLKKHLAIGEKIQIDYIDARGQLHECSSQVVEIDENDFVDILIPIYKTHEISLGQDSIIKLIVSKGEAVYEFKAVVYEKLFQRIPVLRLKIISEVNKIQRRDFFRLKMMRDIEVKQIEGNEEKRFSEKIKCNLHDISAGGILISSKKEFQEGEMLELMLDLNGVDLVVYGIIVRRTLTVSHKYPYAYGVKFDKLSEFDKNKVTKFIFEEQRKLIKKGLI
jgi:c-di-GMP-binding flagellar brake protein YcgR